MEEKMLTPKEAAERIGVSDQTIYNWIAARIFHNVIKRGIFKKRYLIPISEVERIRQMGNESGNSYTHYASA
jgi:excisionase family DNA binding protein